MSSFFYVEIRFTNAIATMPIGKIAYDNEIAGNFLFAKEKHTRLGHKYGQKIRHRE